MKVIFRNSSIVFQEGERRTEIPVTREYNNVLANQGSRDVAISFNNFKAIIYAIPAGATTLFYDGGICTYPSKYGISLIKDVTLGEELPTYTNVAKNMFSEEYPAPDQGEASYKPHIQKTIDLSSYQDATHFMVSGDNVMLAQGTGGVSKIYNVG